MSCLSEPSPATRTWRRSARPNRTTTATHPRWEAGTRRYNGRDAIALRQELERLAGSPTVPTSPVSEKEAIREPSLAEVREVEPPVLKLHVRDSLFPAEAADLSVAAAVEEPVEAMKPDDLPARSESPLFSPRPPGHELRAAGVPEPQAAWRFFSAAVEKALDFNRLICRRSFAALVRGSGNAARGTPPSSPTATWDSGFAAGRVMMNNPEGRSIVPFLLTAKEVVHAGIAGC